jgi:hypothetical protein
MIEFFEQFNESFYGIVNSLNLYLPFCLCISLIIWAIIVIIKFIKLI